MIDALVVLGESLFGRGLEVADAVAQAKSAGVERIIAAPARGRDYSTVAANDRLFADTRLHPTVSRLARIDPNQGENALVELERAVTGLGCVGVFLNPDEEVFRIQDAAPVARLAGELGVPVVVVAGVVNRSEPLQVLELSQTVPGAQIVLTSGGQINISGLGMVDAWAALERSQNMSVLTNGEYRQDFLERIPKELGPERLLFASFAPYYEQPFEVARVRNVPFSDDVRETIEHGNAERLFKLVSRGA